MLHNDCTVVRCAQLAPTKLAWHDAHPAKPWPACCLRPDCIPCASAHLVSHVAMICALAGLPGSTDVTFKFDALDAIPMVLALPRPRRRRLRVLTAPPPPPPALPLNAPQPSAAPPPTAPPTAVHALARFSCWESAGLQLFWRCAVCLAVWGLGYGGDDS